MHHFQYVSKKEAMPFKKELIEMIHKVQNKVRNKFTFQFTFIGSTRRNMITCDPRTNIGFDFDVNLEVHDNDERYTPKEIRNILRNALDTIAPQYGYSACEDSTRVLTLKKIDHQHARIVHSCDLAIVHYSALGQRYIRYNKKAGTYTWEFQKQPNSALEERACALKQKGHWEEVKREYLEKKNRNIDSDKHSRSLYAETVNECYMRHFESASEWA